MVERFENEIDIHNVGVSGITAAELQFGAEKSGFGERNLRALNLFLAALTIHPFGGSIAPTYARLRATLERQGTPIGPLDTLIAAHALSLEATLVTNNTREFARAPELLVENWGKLG